MNQVPDLKNQKKRIAFFLPNLDMGGAERVSINLANGIAQRNHTVDIVAGSACGAFLEQIASNVNVVDLHSSRIITSIRPLIRYINDYQPNVLVSAIHANFAAIIARMLSRNGNTRIVVTQHSHMSRYAGDGGWKVRIEPRLAQQMFPLADAIVAVSNGVAADLSVSSRIPRSEIEVIYNPVIMPELADKKQASIEHPWFGVGESPVILAAGRLVNVKGFHDLINAFAQVRAQRPARLMILGEGPNRAALEHQIQSLGLAEDVSLPGFVENPYPYMAQADLFVLSSIFEGLPTVLVEALYCDVPVISTDCPSGPAEILADGRFGRLTPVGDPEALATNILAALDGGVPQPNPVSWQPYTMDYVVDQYLDILLQAPVDSVELVSGVTA